MALKLLQPGTQPLGQFDGLDTEVLTLKGGEICTFTAVFVPPTGTDKASADSFSDGYLFPSVQKRVAVTRNVSSSARPLMLSDEGILGYGTLFGSVVGGTVGQQMNGPNSFTGAVLGPHTATGSGKVTLWEKPGVYAVSLDAVDTNSDGLNPSNTSLLPGLALTYIPNSSTGGQLTPVGSASAAGNTTVVGRFIDFETNGSLVTTPNKLVAALNSPSGIVSSVGPLGLQFATFYFNPSN